MIFGHYSYWFNRSHPFGGIYDYDPADDGPECEVITRILASYPYYVPGDETIVEALIKNLRQGL